EGGREPHVHDRHVRTLLGQRLDQLRTGRHGRDHVEAVRGQQVRQAAPEKGEVFGEDNAHGTSSVTVVGPPGGLVRTMSPSNVARRPPTPRNPVPLAGSAPPPPSSTTVTRSLSACTRMSTL